MKIYRGILNHRKSSGATVEAVFCVFLFLLQKWYIFLSPNFPIFVPPRVCVTYFVSPGVPLDSLVFFTASCRWAQEFLTNVSTYKRCFSHVVVN